MCELIRTFQGNASPQQGLQKCFYLELIYNLALLKNVHFTDQQLSLLFLFP